MERNWENDLSKPLYRKLPGTGGLRLRKPMRRIKPGQRVRITAEELGKYIKEFELLEDPKVEKKKETTEDQLPVSLKREKPINDRFKAVSTGHGWFDVIDVLTDKKVNIKKLRQNTAEKYAEDLSTGKTKEMM